MDYNNPFYCEYIYDADVHSWTFKADVTEYVHVNDSPGDYAYEFAWIGNVFVYGGDYGGNERSYAVKVDATRGLAVSTTSAQPLLAVYILKLNFLFSLIFPLHK